MLSLDKSFPGLIFSSPYFIKRQATERTIIGISNDDKVRGASAKTICMMKMNKSVSKTETGNKASGDIVKEEWILRLYVAGSTPQSTHAIANIKNICEAYLKGLYELEVIDLYQNPGLAKAEQIIAAPTLIKKLPLPSRRIIGDLSDTDRLLVGLDLRKLKKSDV